LKSDRTGHNAARTAGAWQHVANTLQADIIFGRIHLREHLVEDEIMKRLDISRHTTRRALDELERLGLTVREPNRGVYVRSYTADEVENLYEIREMLETRGSSRIPLPASHELIKRLSYLQEQHETASRKEQLVDVASLNNEFHDTLYRACGNPMLSEAIRLYSLRTQPIRVMYSSDASWREQAVADHWRIIRALKHRDSGALSLLCREHLQGPKLHYLRLYHISHMKETLAIRA
jgi:DNA-binding GntR family transcriptional regulator